MNWPAHEKIKQHLPSENHIKEKTSKRLGRHKELHISPHSRSQHIDVEPTLLFIQVTIKEPTKSFSSHSRITDEVQDVRERP